MSALYLYALVSEAPTAALGAGLAGEPLRLVRCGALLAVAGEIDAPPRLEAPALRAHDGTVRRLAGLAEAILPARFGTLAGDEHELGALLQPHTPALCEALALVAGCEQMSLRVFGPAPTARPAADAASTLGPGARYMATRLREHQQSTAVPDLAPLHRALGELIRAERVEPHGTPPLLASVYHLVARGHSAAYHERLDATRGALAPLRLEVSGPWPPYAFASPAMGTAA